MYYVRKQTIKFMKELGGVMKKHCNVCLGTHVLTLLLTACLISACWQTGMAAQKPVFQFQKVDSEEQKQTSEKISLLTQEMDQLKAEIAILRTLIQTNKERIAHDS